VQVFPESDELNVSAANIARSRFDEAASGRYQVSRVKAAMSKPGGVGRVARRAAKRAKRALRR
jgi:hypothetical protein